MKTINIGDTITFGATRKMEVVSVKNVDYTQIAQVITVKGSRGAVAVADVYKSGRIFLR